MTMQHRVDVFFCRIPQLPIEESVIQHQRKTLSNQEVRAADRLVDTLDQHRFILSHALLRQILALRLGLLPEEILIERTESGKPYLVPDQTLQPHDLNFSLSHSQGFIAMALGDQLALGIDVEDGQVPESIDMAQLCFHPHEAAWIADLPSDQRLCAFLQLWTLKESYLKATGGSLRLPIEEISFGLEASPQIKAVSVCRTRRQNSESWRFFSYGLSDQCRAALCVGLPTGHALEIEVQDIGYDGLPTQGATEWLGFSVA